MKNLTIHRLAFSVLMMCVLVFGVQGIAEGVAEPTDFAQTEATIITDREPGDSVTVNALTLTLDDPARIESVKIVGSSGVIITSGIGVGKSSVTYTEVDADLTDTSNGTIASDDVDITFTNVGRKTVTISGTDNDSNEDGTVGDRKGWSFQYIFYVSEPATSRSTTVSLTGVGSKGYKYPYWPGVAEKVHSASGNYTVTYAPPASLDIHLSTTDKRHLTGTGADIDGVVPVPGDGIVSSAFNVHLKTALDATQTITATLGGPATTAVYIGGSGGPPTLALSGVFTTNAATNPVTSSGDPGANIVDAITATVTDGAGTGIPGILVRFDVRDRSHAGGTLVFPATTTPAGTLVGSNNRVQLDTNGAEITSGADKTLYVQTTGTTGTATLNFLLGTAGEQEITVTAIGQTKKVSAFTSAATSGLQLIRDDIRQRGSMYDLYVRVEDDGSRVGAGYAVEFFTSQGDLTNTPDDPSTDTPETSSSVTEDTDARGIAHVKYDPGDSSGTLIVIARIRADANAPTPAGAFVDDLTLNVSGGPVTRREDPEPTRTEPALSFNIGTSIRGSEGDAITIEARATDRDGQRVSQVPITFTLSNSDAGSLSVSSGNTQNGVLRTILTLGNEDGQLTATTTDDYRAATASITIQPAYTDLEAVSGSGQTDTPGSTLSSPFVVRFEDTDGDPVPNAVVTFTVETGGGSVSPTTDTTDSNGEAETTLTLGSVGMRNTVRASVSSTDYPGVGSVTFTAEAERPAEAVIIAGGDGQIGQVGRLLDEDLSVQVVDSDDNGVSGVLVRFRITEGRGRLSRNSDRTDPDGYAEIGFTPTTDGEVVVEAYATGLTSAFFTITTGEPPDAITLVSGNNQSGRPGARLANPLVVEVIDENDDPVSGVSVSFSVTGGGGSVSPTSATTNNNGRAQTRLTLGDDPGENTVVASVSGLSDRVTFKATSGMQVHLAASRRPVMYWISGAEGKLYRLAGDAVESLAPNLTGITNIAVDAANNVLYLSVQTGPNKGEIRRATLDGGNVRTLKQITAVPRGITVDSTGDTLYWANSRGRIQSMPTAGSAKLTNVLENLRNPTIVISNGHLYWTESIGRIRRISLTDTQRTIQNIATGLGEPLGLAIAKGKVYWIERAAGGSGSLNRSNLDGSNRQSLKTFASGVPTSLAVDSGDNKLYWTKGAGKLQRSNLAGKFVRDVASGLMGPRGIALSVAVSDGTPVRSTPATQNTQQPTTYSVYDINEDGAVNNADTRLVAADVGNSGTAIKNKRADVDGSGTVDVTDLILVLGNLDDDVAAPAIEIDVKALDVDFDRVQEQVEVLLASGDRSIAAQRALLYLQHLLASARPDETVLLANYPNPFNPETWIPYHLSESTDVRVNIYDAQGTLVRELTLGHQTAGYYTSRSRAAYWDGRNALGERVASGIYFYQLQTDTVSPMRKMVILK